MATGGSPVLLEVPLHGLGELVGPRLLERQLDGLVAVRGLRLDLGHETRPSLDHRHGDGPRVVEDLGHAQLRPQDALGLGHGYSLISMSTPADRFRRWSS